MPRYELPPGLSPEEERAVLAALERAMASGRPRLSPWALAGRAEATRRGRLQVRRDIDAPWAFRAPVPFAAGGPQKQVGRGDAR
jgi:hypothetical protein